MRIQHNIMAMNAYRNYNTNTSALSKNLEKLSSGYKINRAGDDAAGLAISEKMRAQITGLNAAQKNVKDGISLVKTAEGAMQEIQDMLNRMDYLATQSANGTYDNEVDRANLQKEVDALKKEINRIADSANFNGIKLLDGSQNGVNTDAFTVTSTKVGDMVPGALDSIASSAFAATNASKPAYHPGTANTPEQRASFNLDLSDLAVKGDGAAADTLSIEFAGVTGTVAVSSTADMDAADIAAALKTALGGTDGTVSIGGAKFNITDNSDGTLTFKLADDVDLTSALVTSINGAIDGTDANVVVTSAATKAEVSGDWVHGLQDVDKAVLEVKGDRAGIDLTLDTNIVSNGKRLTIDGKTFVFKTGTADVEHTDDEILIDVSAETSAANQTKLAAQLIGNNGYTTDNFQISNRGDNIIHIDQEPSSTNEYLTHDSLKAVFELRGAPTKATENSLKLDIDESEIKDGDKLTIGGKTYTFSSNPNAANNEIAMTADALKAALEKEGYSVTKGTNDAGDPSLTIKKGTATSEPTVKTGGLQLQIGDTSDSYNQLDVRVGDMHTKALGIDGLDISTPEGASAAIQTIRDAINNVSSVRGDLGAVQNRLEHTANNLSVMAENIQDAESTIRDTDVAEEMMAYTKNNILIQSAQAMLAQANQVPQGVLQLLQ